METDSKTAQKCQEFIIMTNFIRLAWGSPSEVDLAPAFVPSPADGAANCSEKLKKDINKFTRICRLHTF
jgi:hypothetical protein